MEIYTHNLNKISIRDLDGDIEIRQKKWTFLFEFILKQTSAIYFRGTRLEFMDKDLKSDIALLLDQNVGLFEEDYFRVLFKVKESCVSIGRGMIDNVWDHYEYPCIIFLKEELHPHDFKRLFNARFYEDIFAIIEGGYLVYKSLEPDVLWVEKTMDMKFPEELQEIS